MPRTILEERQYRRRQSIKRLRILLGLSIALLLLFLIVLFAALRKGGFSNLIKGDGNVVTNTVKNIGTSFVGTTPTPTENKNLTEPVQPPAVAENKNDITTNKSQNYIVFEGITNDYEITIKKGTYIAFSNQAGQPIGLKFSNSRDLKLEPGSEQNMLFSTVADIRFEDIYDSSSFKIKGIVHVVN